eukprot:GHRQ01039501.1.p1 GENE.GHRQ01039501.1~~GHRQ01039501.1.p1  ORF type:complete len:104 (+),score=19.45 GHRQ01039501.1:1-312(+)
MQGSRPPPPHPVKFLVKSSVVASNSAPVLSSSTSPACSTMSPMRPGCRFLERFTAITAAPKRPRKPICLTDWPTIGALFNSVTCAASRKPYAAIKLCSEQTDE